jgi:DNA-binding winged helix-turn-helix (wHTH) protein
MGFLEVYEFGPYRLSLADYKLWRGDEEVKLRPKLFDLLRVFAQHRGEVLEKDDLIRLVWQDAIVEENNLTVTVNALRTILGEGNYIETIPRRGYRFIPEVKAVYGAACARPTPAALHPPGGAVPLGSMLYISRPADDEFCRAIAGKDSIVLVKGARQVGKTSLLARGLNEARGQGAVVVLIDFQQFAAKSFETSETLLSAVAETIAYQLELAPPTDQSGSGLLGATSKFERFLRREVLARIQASVVCGLDEVDRLFSFDYANEIFGLFRSLHNRRALDPNEPWHSLTLAMAYATEAHLFITDLNQSPFNVGTRLMLGDFTLDQVSDLNQRYGAPLKDQDEIERFHKLLGGHPYLTQRALYEMVRSRLGFAAIEAAADQDDGVFGDHLRRMLLSLEQDPALLDQVRRTLQGDSHLSRYDVSRLRNAGVLSGEGPFGPQLRCELYARYLKMHLA